MKYYILFNPNAGSGSGEAKANALTAQYEGEVSCLNMTTIDSYADFFSTITPADTVVLCGGDGTLNRFINDTKGLKLSCNILYCATGTGNDFLKDLPDVKENEPIRINEYLCDLPTVEIDGKQYHFLNGVGYGIDGYCCEIGDKLKKKSSKAVNYTSIAIKGLLFHFKPRTATVTVDGQSFTYKKVWIAPTMKGRFYGGGMMMAPKQDRLNENKEVSLVLLHGSGKLKTLMVFPSIFKGEHIKYTDIVTTHTGKEISVSFDRPTALQIDGETVLGVTGYHVTAKALAPVAETV